MYDLTIDASTIMQKKGDGNITVSRIVEQPETVIVDNIAVIPDPIPTNTLVISVKQYDQFSGEEIAPMVQRFQKEELMRLLDNFTSQAASLQDRIKALQDLLKNFD